MNKEPIFEKECWREGRRKRTEKDRERDRGNEKSVNGEDDRDDETPSGDISAGNN